MVSLGSPTASRATLDEEDALRAAKLRYLPRLMRWAPQMLRDRVFANRNIPGSYLHTVEGDLEWMKLCTEDSLTKI